MKKSSKPLVSILCLSYNQKEYIRQALDSFLMQKINFTYEILINDDASTDGTKEIIEEYAAKHVNIHPVFHKENQYQKGKRNMFIRYLLPKVKGRYIALCEGDDFWTDPKKLQKQVDFLEGHKDYALVFHPVRVFFEKGEHDDEIFPAKGTEYSIESLLKKNFIQTNTVMYRARESYKNMALDVMPGDWYLHLYHAQFGKIGFIDKVMAAYRRHESGLWWSSLDDDKSLFWNTYGNWYIALHTELLRLFGAPKHQDIIIANIKTVYENARNANQDALSRRDAEIASLHRELDEIKTKLALIDQSKIWRLRNKMARYIHRERI